MTLRTKAVGKQLEEMIPAFEKAAYILQNSGTDQRERDIAQQLMYVLCGELDRLFHELRGSRPPVAVRQNLLVAIGLDTPDCPNCRQRTDRSALGYDCPECKTKWVSKGPLILGEPPEMTPYIIARAE